MQFLMMMSLISITVPGITHFIQGVLLNFVQLDILQSDKWLFGLFFDEEEDSADEPLNSYFDQNGYSSRTFIKCAGSALVFLWLYLLLLATMLFLKVLSRFI
jgi:hypothetical protein